MTAKSAQFVMTEIERFTLSCRDGTDGNGGLLFSVTIDAATLDRVREALSPEEPPEPQSTDHHDEGYVPPEALEPEDAERYRHEPEEDYYPQEDEPPME